MASANDLNALYSIPGVLEFTTGPNELVRAEITSPSCSAELYLHGAHLTQWKPTDTAEPVLFLSPLSGFAPGKAIRGGIPVIFPWFGARSEEVTGHSKDGGQHGFARTTEWEVAFAASVGDAVHLVLTFGPSNATRALGFDGFRAALEFRLGEELHVRMTVANEGSEPLVFEEALHTYLQVGDPRQVKLHGLGQTEFLDKFDDFKRKTQDNEVLTLTGATDRPYLNTTASITIEDPAFARKLVVGKGGSRTTVVWNPWSELSGTMADLGPDAWQHFVCVEAANAFEDRITLSPKAAHIMETTISVEPLA
ncbi:D-hexose-6-phosphate mutarotase [Granulicella cerasi]|uniref:D-hexose-6-phosphate mutarotase n=1 Tax=Granulicella cerasi TaxID=741063 RepID=UPI0021E090F3|nr:D-hexose-6-phosphate mutarotase [Granulicella cerasi]